MKIKEKKDKIIDAFADKITNFSNFYLTDISELSAIHTTQLRRTFFENKLELHVVKNTLLKRAMEKSDKKLDSLYDFLKGHTSIIFSETPNLPAKIIKSFRKKFGKPLIKAAYIDGSFYTGDDQLEILCNLKSKNELIADIITLLQSPARNVLSSLQSGKNIIAGIVKTLTDR